jgi:hypothetical protein
LEDFILAHCEGGAALGRGTAAGNDSDCVILTQAMTEFEPIGHFRGRLADRFFHWNTPFDRHAVAAIPDFRVTRRFPKTAPPNDAAWLLSTYE